MEKKTTFRKIFGTNVNYILSIISEMRQELLTIYQRSYFHKKTKSSILIKRMKWLKYDSPIFSNLLIFQQVEILYDLITGILSSSISGKGKGKGKGKGNIKCNEKYLSGFYTIFRFIKKSIWLEIEDEKRVDMGKKIKWFFEGEKVFDPSKYDELVSDDEEINDDIEHEKYLSSDNYPNKNQEESIDDGDDEKEKEKEKEKEIPEKEEKEEKKENEEIGGGEVKKKKKKRKKNMGVAQIEMEKKNYSEHQGKCDMNDYKFESIMFRFHLNYYGKKFKEKKEKGMYKYRNIALNMFKNSKIYKFGICKHRKNKSIEPCIVSQDLSFWESMLMTIIKSLVNNFSSKQYCFLMREMDEETKPEVVKLFTEKVKKIYREYVKDFDENRFKMKDIGLILLTDCFDYCNKDKYYESSIEEGMGECDYCVSKINFLESYHNKFNVLKANYTLGGKLRVLSTFDSSSYYFEHPFYQYPNPLSLIKRFYETDYTPVLNECSCDVVKCSKCGKKRNKKNKNLFKQCGGCLGNPNNTIYCSRSCQKKDWKKHKKECTFKKK